MPTYNSVLGHRKDRSFYFLAGILLVGICLTLIALIWIWVTPFCGGGFGIDWSVACTLPLLLTHLLPFGILFQSLSLGAVSIILFRPHLAPRLVSPIFVYAAILLFGFLVFGLLLSNINPLVLSGTTLTCVACFLLNRSVSRPQSPSTS